MTGIGHRSGVTEQNPVTCLGGAEHDRSIRAHGDQDSTVGECRQQAMWAAMLGEHVRESGIPDAHMTNPR